MNEKLEEVAGERVKMGGSNIYVHKYQIEFWALEQPSELLVSVVCVRDTRGRDEREALRKNLKPNAMNVKRKRDSRARRREREKKPKITNVRTKLCASVMAINEKI